VSATDALQLLIASLPQSQINDLRADDPVRTWFRPNANPTVDTFIDNAANEERRKRNAENDGYVPRAPEISEETPKVGNDAPKPRNKKPGHSIFSPTTNNEGPSATKKRKREKNANTLSLFISANLRHSTHRDEQLLVSADEILI